ncbi:MAG: leucyl aminopeptidase family protein [Candidatus Spechtbacterales bacterium]
MKIQLVTLDKKRTNYILPLFENGGVSAHVGKQLGPEDLGLIQLFLTNKPPLGRGASHTLFLPSGSTALLLGKGNKEAWNQRAARILVRAMVGEMKAGRVTEATVDIDDIRAEKEDEALLEMIAMELLMANLAFNEYKQVPKEGWPTIAQVNLAAKFAPSQKKQYEAAIARGVIVGEETNQTRLLSNTPGGDMTPSLLAKHAQKVGRAAKVKVTVLDEPAIRKLGMGGVIGVCQGSDDRPKFIMMEYKHRSYKGRPLVLVGKGVTFDTGGLNLKPTPAIYEMHMDMSGGAAVIHAMVAIARLGIPLHVIGLVPAVENMPSGSSYRPGDILRSITGKTIEVLNTDAEGRIILADALGYASRFKPRLVVDIATLTGASLVALGDRVNALFTEDEKREQLFRDLGERSGDYLWPLPMWEEYAEDVKGTFGDVANSGKSGKAGATAGAMFLREFVSFPWVHIDMAPTMTANEQDRLAKGAKGTGVRFFVELARYMAEHKEA